MSIYKYSLLEMQYWYSNIIIIFSNILLNVFCNDQYCVYYIMIQWYQCIIISNNIMQWYITVMILLLLL